MAPGEGAQEVGGGSMVGAGFRVQGLGFRVFCVLGLGFKGFGLRVWGQVARTR